MTNNRFISILRDYAALARTRRTSYADAVHELVDARQLSVSLTVSGDAERDKQLRAAEDTAMREYGKFDEAFSFENDD